LHAVVARDFVQIFTDLPNGNDFPFLFFRFSNFFVLSFNSDFETAFFAIYSASLLLIQWLFISIAGLVDCGLGRGLVGHSETWSRMLGQRKKGKWKVKQTITI